ncbi:MAG: translation initiation factor IF-2 [Bacteroidaceae bacterium]|nr:translation initiation factor IF-2 [Bacteroidaceae bacterium]
MSIRLNKVTRDLNVGITTVVEFLQKKGYAIEANPNTKISEEQYAELVKEFSTDKNLKKETEKLMQERQAKPKQAEPVVAEPKKEEQIDLRPESKFKPVGKIDLDNLNKRTPAPAKEPEPVKVQEPEPVEVKKPEPQVELVKVESPEVKGAQEEDGVFKIRPTEFKSSINVLGKIDLDALNQSTRPKKKTKEEKKKERDEKEKQRQQQRQQMKESIIKEIRKDKPAKDSDEEGGKKKKRNRIGKERVDINAAGNQQGGNPRKEGKDGHPGKNANAGGKPGKDQGKPNKDRFKKPAPKVEVSDEDVAKQVKETLARLTNKTKNKAAKYRKEKRENVRDRMMEQEEMEQEESKILKLTEFVTANELANMMDVPVTKVIGTCMSIGMMVSINQRLDAETINLVAEEFGYQTEYVSAEVSQAITEEADAEEDLVPRAPIVTVMGHVDHGKTSLLDYIRKANVIAGEAGGITQHIGAYNVKLEDGRHITFLDTPGHEAFTAMRARGAKVTDIVIIIVAADDNVMPQTKEAINHAMAAGVPIVFAINKIDKPAANPDKIKEELAAMNFLVEEWGGKYQSQDISAKKGLGVEDLLEKVLLEAEMLELKANPDRKATGSIIESSLDKGRGYVATVLVSNGTLRVGDIVLAGTSYGKVKAMFNERNQRIKEAGPAEPVLILGLNGAPAAGDTFHVFDTDQEAREVANKREQLQREQGLRTQKMLTLDEVGRRLALGDFHELNIIVKGDVDGSVEALSDSLIKLSTEQIQVNVIHKGVGQISESDVTLAAASDAIIVGFQVRPSASAGKLAEQEGVDIRKYSVIYDAIEEVKAAMEGMLAPTLKEQVTATIEVREVFNISKVGQVAGAMVKTGKVKRSDRARLIRDGIVVFTGNINALKRFKDDVKEVGTNFECGISLTSCNDIKVGDVIETFEEIEVKQTL